MGFVCCDTPKDNIRDLVRLFEVVRITSTDTSSLMNIQMYFRAVIRKGGGGGAKTF